MADNKKNYVRGSAKQVTFHNGSIINNFSLNILDANILKEAGIPADLAKQLIALREADEARPKADKLGTGWAQLVLSEKREIDQFDNSHYIYVNEFKPDKAKGKPKPKAAPAPEVDDEELPF
jgi:hypothetical protein